MRTRGLTLIEVLVTLGLLGIIASLGLFATLGEYRGDTLRSERDTFVALLTRARAHAMNNIAGVPHGFCVDANDYVVFAGTFSQSAIEEYQPLSRVVARSGFPACGSGSEILFTQLSGTTTQTTLTLLQNGQTLTVSVNGEGMVGW